ncbi:hypothetical protein [Pseudomonas citronellolis]|uniref:hypothetical protein n=1 Tax=Pseudomonas citronellolis TaxID=53408 RepID=UPI0023E3D033|nr:hypothetical protein [Pseudomonas citronellolis]MDF3933396.1 hypothetical protein [Pseudomonas citronellolis]
MFDQVMKQNMLVLGVERTTVERSVFVSAFVGRQPETERVGDTRGYAISKIGVEPSVFDKFPAVTEPVELQLHIRLVKAAGGKMQPRIVDVEAVKAGASAPRAAASDKPGA